jgi:fucose 4-O-acetylase-like acetyltransferase
MGGAFYSRNALYANASDTIIEVPNNNIDLMTALNAPLWFLTCLFITLILYKLIMTLAKGSARREFFYLGISILIGTILKYFCPILLPWSIDTALISVGFIHIGKILNRENIVHKLYKNPFYILAVFLVFISTSYINGSVNMSIRDFGKSVLIYIIVGGSGSVLVMLISKVIEEHSKILKNLLVMIGKHTIGILAFHLVIFAVIAYALGIINISGGWIEKVAIIIASVVILVPTDWFIQEYLPFVYGKKRRKNEK